ncbi:MAG: carboxymuconolactone decarboxylase family protein [Novosphingobium sp.]|uniref:carboxymuconolactone decarboxylase family protein n=1 Tax=Novosphingobium sp. TaxID=1874826 RepID=UPI0032B7B101
MSLIQTMTGGSVRYLAPVKRAKATGLVAAVYGAIEREFALVPPLTIHSACPEILAGAWSAMREAFVVDPDHRALREAVASGVSLANRCPYCVDVHTAMLDASGDHALADRIRSAGAGDNALIAWASATRQCGAPALEAPPFAKQLVPQLLGTAVLFHYINRLVSVFLSESAAPLRLRSALPRKLFGRAFGGTVGRHLLAARAEPGASLHLLPDAPLPREFVWAAADRAIAGGLARLDAAVEAAGALHVPEPVRALVAQRVGIWRGEDVPLSDRWLAEAVSELAADDQRASARLALQTALAAYRVDGALIAAFRRHFPGDAPLLATAAWSSLTATRRLAGWMLPNG